jgi:XTP/dITP diphosphohydrolase
MKNCYSVKKRRQIKEIKNFLHGLDIEILTLNDFSDIPEIEEDGRTFEENAIKKAKTVFELTKLTALADDSGLEVKYLGGQPGVNSAYFAGEKATDQQNNDKLLELLKDVQMDDRKARFKCTLVLHNSLYNNLIFEGKWILDTHQPMGELGFDMTLVCTPLYQTFELDLVTKNRFHRGRALGSLRSYVEKCKPFVLKFLLLA